MPSARRVLAGLGLILVATAAMLVSGGCAPYGTIAPQGVDTLSVALPSQFGEGQAQFFFYRIMRRATGERLGVGREFHVAERRQVRAVLQLEGVTPGEALLLHVMWLNPDGKEVYLKEVMIASSDWGNAARCDSLSANRVLLDPETGCVEIESRYGVSPDRFDEELHKPAQRRVFKTGTWSVRIYLYRKLLLESSFELLPSR